MTRHRRAEGVACAASIALAAVTGMALAQSTQNGKDCVGYSLVGPAVGPAKKIEVFCHPTDRSSKSLPADELGCLLRQKDGSGEKQNGRYHFWSSKRGEFWVPTWQIAIAGPQDPFQPFLRPPRAELPAPIMQAPPRTAAPSSLALSPTQSLDENAMVMPHSPKNEEHLCPDDTPPSSESTSKAIR
jgi:hypothetical protein